MKNILCGFIMISALSLNAQEEPLTLGSAIDKLTYQWDDEAVNLNNYEGLAKFCDDQSYRSEIITLLNEIHHYDSVLYDQLVKTSRFNKDKEIEKTLDRIAEFEENYSMKKFIHFLHEECITRTAIERTSEASKKDIGEHSYDGKVYLIETELNKFIKQITRSVDNLRKHVHHLHIK